MNLATFRSPDRTCLVCGTEAAGHRLVDVHPADDPSIMFRLELPLCDGHKDDPEDDLIERFQASYQMHQAEQEASQIQEQAAELLKGRCLVCDRPPFGIKLVYLDEVQAAKMDAAPESFCFVALCKKCGDATGEDYWLDAVNFQKEVDDHATFKN